MARTGRMGTDKRQLPGAEKDGGSSLEHRGRSRRYPGRIRKYWLVLVLILCLPGLSYGFTVTAQVDQTRIRPGESVSLQVIVDGGKGEVDLSPVTDFQVLSSGTRSSRSYVNGKSSYRVIYQYLLMPKKTGVLKIPELVVVRDGERALTREIQILVTGEADAGKGKPAYFARASLSSPEAVLGQQVVYTLKLFSSGNFAGASFDPPGFDRLTATELTQWKKYTEHVDGQTFLVNEIKYLLQGSATGRFDISPAIFVAREKVERRRSGSQDPFDSFFNDSFFNTVPTKPVRVVSNPVTLEIVPLPPYTGDHPFSGLVGTFTMGATLDKTRIKAGESATLTVTIQGLGNIMDADFPGLELPDDRFKVYKDTPVEDVEATEKGVAGKKIFKQALVPGTAGDVTIPSLSLTFFDVGSEAYKTVSTAPIQLEVVPGEPSTLVRSGETGETSAGLPGGKKQAVVVRNQDILDIREDISGISSDTHLPLHWFAVLVMMPGLGFACFNLALRFRTREKTLGEYYRAKARSHLAEARKAEPGSPDFLSALQSALTAAVLSRGDRRAESLTREEAAAILARSGEEDADRVLEMMDTLDAARFGGAAMGWENAGRCLSDVRQLVKSLVLVLCLALWAGAGSGPVRASDLAGLFVDGTRAYQAEAYQAAVEKFESVAGSGVKNPDLFYNLGNAYLKTGDLGRAVLWYERARRLSPNDPDLQFNMDYALTRIKDRSERAFNVSDVLFFWKGLISLKWLQYGAIASSLFFFVWAGARRIFRKRVFSGPGILLTVLLVSFIAASGLENFRLNSDRRAVILSDSVAVRSGTMATATPLFDLHAGTRVRVMEIKAHHLKIWFAKGKVGWVSADDAEII